MSLLKILTSLGKKEKKEKKEVLPIPSSPADTLKILKDNHDKIQAEHKLMEDHPRRRRLDEDQQKILVTLIAQGLTFSQVVKEFRERTDITITVGTVHDYKHAEKWAALLKEEREKFLNRIDLLDGSHKAVRIRRMEQVFDRAVSKDDLKASISANEQIRKEFQGEGETNVFWNNPVYQQFNSLSNEELIRRHKEATAKLKETQ